jgi:hypothetical protein
MHKVIESYLRNFVTQYELEAIDQAEQFERFVNYCIINEFYPDHFDLEVVTTASNDPSIDGICVLLNNEIISTADEGKSHLDRLKRGRSAEAHYLFIQAKRSDHFDAGEMLKFTSGVTALFQASPRTDDEVVAEFLQINESLLNDLSKIQNGRPRITLYYTCTGTWDDNNGLRKQVIDPTVATLTRLDLFDKVDVVPIDRDGLIKRWNKSKEPVKASFNVKGTVALPPVRGVTEAYLTLVRADEFVANVLSDKDGRIRTTVFEQNVRAFLGDDNEVNRKIKDSLADTNRRDRFAINNNGLTLVATDVSVQSDRFTVVDYQLVNGCQTSHVLFRNRDKLSDAVWVPLKVIEAQDADVVAELVESTNSQTIVDDPQFISIRPFAQKLEAYFSAVEVGTDDADKRLYFERRTNQYAGTSISRKRIFDIPRLARVFAAMFLDLPHITCKYPTQILTERGQYLFRDDHNEHLYHTAALALYRLDLALGNQYVPRKYQGYQWHILMLLRYLIAGSDMPRFDSKNIEKYCAQIDAVFSQGGKASAPPFLECIKIIDQIGEVSRDRRRGKPYTDELKQAVAGRRFQFKKAKPIAKSTKSRATSKK